MDSEKLHAFVTERLTLFASMYKAGRLEWVRKYRPDLSFLYRTIENLAEKVALLFLDGKTSWLQVRVAFKCYEAMFLYLDQAHEDYPTSAVWSEGQYKMLRRALKTARIKEVVVPFSYVAPHVTKRPLPGSERTVGGKSVPCVAVLGG